MRYNRLTRRMFFTGAGTAVLSLPLLPSLLPRSLQRDAKAATPTVPRRFVAIKTYSGTPVRAFYPGDGAGGFPAHPDDGRAMLTQDLPEATGQHSDGNEYFGTWAPLSAFASGGVSRIFNTEFNRHHANMSVFRGLDIMPDLNHNHGAMLGNFGLRTNGVGGVLPGAQINATIDQVMARSPNVYPSAPAGPRILHVGSRANTCSYAPVDPNNVLATGLDAIAQAQAYINPRVAFDSVLAGVGDGSEPSEVRPTVRLLDRVLDDYRQAVSGPRLSAADRQILDQHVTRLTELEARLNSGVGMDCSEPMRPESLDAGGEFEADVSQVTQLFDDMVDIIIVALSCDVTRICTLDITKMIVDDDGTVFGMGDSENADSAGRENWHFQAHTWDADDTAIRWLTLGSEWVAQRVIMRLLDGLAGVTQDDEQSLLHHSMVVWANELSFNHLSYSLPTAVWGQAGGYLKTGRYVDYIDHNRPVRFRQHDGPVIEGLQYNRFVATMAQAMGLSPDEYELTPGGGFGESQTLEKNDLWAIDYDQSNIGDVLPDIRA